MVSEITVIIKDSEKTLSNKFLQYSDYSISSEDPIVKACIDEIVKQFQGNPETIKIRINMQVQ